MTAWEPTALDEAMADRYALIDFGAVGPLTRDQQDAVDSYHAYCVAAEAEYEAARAAGGRTICDGCGQRAVVARDVITLGYAGHPGAEVSVYRKCESCGRGEL